VPEIFLAVDVNDLKTWCQKELLGFPAILLAPVHQDSGAFFVKRPLDIMGAVILLVILSSLFAVVPLAIKITTPRLSIFYPWHVVGRNGV
jgi:lipopolysaccharide/colanic/teichoic acid biosynthesis glycosyltransferase